MAQSNDLLILIQSLTKSEKRYFKMYASLQEGSKAYLGLFDLLESEDDINSVKIKFDQNFKKSTYDSSRKHLYKIIMRCLRNYETDKSIDQKLLTIIADTKILFNKGLNELGFSEIERGKKIALKHEKFFPFLLLARMELHHLTLIEFPDLDESSLLAKQEKINAVLYDELTVNKYSSLYELLLHRYIHKGVIRSEDEQRKLNDLVLEEFQVNANQRFHNFQTDRLHLHFQSTYFLITGDPKQSLEEFYRLNALIEEQPNQREEDPLYYVYLLHGILLNLRTLGDYAASRSFISRLKTFEVNASGIQKIIQHLIFQHEVSLLIDQGKFNEGLHYFHEFEKQGGLKNYAPSNLMASTQLSCAVLFFGMGDFKKALRQANAALDLPERYISKYVYVVCRIIVLIIHLELRNDDLLSYSIKSFERKLKLGKLLFRTERITIDFLKKWIAATDSTRKQILIKFEEQLTDLLSDKYEQQVLKSFDLIRWARARYKKVSFDK
jgi:hypothetical protein